MGYTFKVISKQMDREGGYSDHTCSAKQLKFRALCLKAMEIQTPLKQELSKPGTHLENYFVTRKSK